MDVIKLVAIGPIVLCIVDFEAAVGWDAEGLLDGLERNERIRTMRVGWGLDLFREHLLLDILSLGQVKMCA